MLHMASSLFQLFVFGSVTIRVYLRYHICIVFNDTIFPWC